METDEDVVVARCRRNDKGEFWDVFDADPNSHVRIGKVGFAHEYWPEAWIGCGNTAKQAWEGVSELHGLVRCCGLDYGVESTIGVVIDGAVAAVVLWDARRGG